MVRKASRKSSGYSLIPVAQHFEKFLIPRFHRRAIIIQNPAQRQEEKDTAVIRVYTSKRAETICANISFTWHEISCYKVRARGIPWTMEVEIRDPACFRHLINWMLKVKLITEESHQIALKELNYLE